MDLQTLENEVMAWRLRFPQHEYRSQDDCVALKFECAYGCHCDLDPGMKSDKCVLDEGRSWDCTKAQQLLRDGKGRNDCDEWKPIIERPNVEHQGPRSGPLHGPVGPQAMNNEQLEALMEYIQAVAEREAVLAACGSDAGGYAQNEQASEKKLRKIMSRPNGLK